MRLKIKLLLCLSLFLTGLPSAMSQLSGTINTYTKITAVDYACNFITAASITGFSAGDKVLILQMQGATIDQTNTVNFGNITAIGDAGNYEFAIIDHFAGNSVYLTKTLLRTYTPSGAVQMINVPQYDAVSIDGELNAKAWDGSTGGVVVFESSATVTMNADINVSEQGFRGGAKSPDGGDCSSLTLFYPSNIYSIAFPSVQAGQKGEGIAAYITGKESSTGKNANGGGGGGSHNTGGGGGGNYGAGGRGGNSKCGTNPFGIASLGLGTTYYNTTLNKLFMGGGGGGGHANNGRSFNGGNGGGIVLIKAATLNTNGYTIRSNGQSVNSYYVIYTDDNGDGNSGGGGGGTIMLDVQNYPITAPIEAIGGKGGNTGYTNLNFGPGGGGGGGVAWLSSSTSLTVSANINGGNAGISGLGGANGLGTSFGAVNGSNGAILNNLAISQSTSSSSCALPVELLSFQAKAVGSYSVQLHWSTASEFNNDYFTLEKSADGIHFSPVTTVKGQANTNELIHYSYTDDLQEAYEMLYYRLWQTDLDGHTVNLGIKKVYPAKTSSIITTIYPNPCQDKLYLQLSADQKENTTATYFINTLGEVLNVELVQEGDLFYLNTTGLSKGLYSLLISFKDSNQIVKVIKE